MLNNKTRINSTIYNNDTRDEINNINRKPDPSYEEKIYISKIKGKHYKIFTNEINYNTTRL